MNRIRIHALNKRDRQVTGCLLSIDWEPYLYCKKQDPDCLSCSWQVNIQSCMIQGCDFSVFLNYGKFTPKHSFHIKHWSLIGEVENIFEQAKVPKSQTLAYFSIKSMLWSKLAQNW